MPISCLSGPQVEYLANLEDPTDALRLFAEWQGIPYPPLLDPDNTWNPKAMKTMAFVTSIYDLLEYLLEKETIPSEAAVLIPHGARILRYWALERPSSRYLLAMAEKELAKHEKMSFRISEHAKEILKSYFREGRFRKNEALRRFVFTNPRDFVLVEKDEVSPEISMPISIPPDIFWSLDRYEDRWRNYRERCDRLRAENIDKEYQIKATMRDMWENVPRVDVDDMKESAVPHILMKQQMEIIQMELLEKLSLFVNQTEYALKVEQAFVEIDPKLALPTKPKTPDGFNQEEKIFNNLFPTLKPANWGIEEPKDAQKPKGKKQPKK